jgi:hypothetical protein
MALNRNIMVTVGGDLNNHGPQLYQYQQNEQSFLLPHTIELK